MSINLAEHELAGQCREPTGARTPSASGPPNLGRRGRNAQSRTPPSFGFDPIEGLATGSVSWLDAQPPFDPGNGGESQGFRVFGSNGISQINCNWQERARFHCIFPVFIDEETLSSYPSLELPCCGRIGRP